MFFAKIQSLKPKKCMGTLISSAGFCQELTQEQLIQCLHLDKALMSVDRAKQYSV